MKIGTWNWERDTNEMLHDATSVALFGYEDGAYPFRTFQEHLTRHDADSLDQPTTEALTEFPSTQPVQ